MVILRPGFLLNRDNDYRFGEKVASWIPFIPKVSSEDWAKWMIMHTSETIGKDKSEESVTLTNSDIKDLAKKYIV